MTDTRPCTCAPDERPYPCQHQYSLGLCRKAEIRSLRDALFQAQEAAKQLLQVNIKLVGTIDLIRETLNGGEVQDLHQIINAALAAHRNTQ